MASSTMQLHSLFILLSLLISISSAAAQASKHYVVYMGGSDHQHEDDEGGAEAAELAHLTLLSSIIPSDESERLSLIHSYNHAFKGFSALLTESEASLLSDLDEVVSVFPDPTLQLTTTRSWDFLDAQSGVGSHHTNGPDASAQDVIIGVIDTGVWPESLSFSDEGIGEIPSRWKGVCMEGHDFNKSNCNRKLIGARYYNVIEESSELKSKRISNKTRPRKGSGTPRDSIGHGTHTASTAAGAPVANASYFGIARGTARGGSPFSRLATYKACNEEGCSGANVLKAIDDAIKDGVDIISISISMSSIFQSDFLSDPIAIGAFHANQKGVMVVCSAGNEGPDLSTVVNSAPWIFTVAASTIDRAFLSTVVLGNGHILHGSGINFSNLTRSKMYPLAFGRDVAGTSVPLSEASNCYPGSLDAKKTAGKIIVCINTDPTVSRRIKKLVTESARAVGMLLIDEASKEVAFDTGAFPFSQLGGIEGMQILKYINSTKNPMATILPTMDIKRFKPAPVVASFSSRGPGQLTETILKPDVVAPGVGILAAMAPKGEEGIPLGMKPSNFAIKSGTSMACPHVAGIAAVLKSLHRNWSPSMIKSALMTTATMSNNLGKPFTNSTYNPASPLEVGAGEVSPLRAINPGLVYETTPQDYVYFLCYYGYKSKVIRSVAGPKSTCPKNSSEDLISDINYPSISIRSLQVRRSVRTVRRTVTNVGPANATYTVNVNSPAGLDVEVRPEKLVFDETTTKASFEVSFSSNGAAKGYNFGSLTWSHGLHSVQTVFAVNIM
ncbi:hypothetical protein Scep_003127 [Stephania cephalantha]|uniref:Subtilisin-like protease n=1 Tax=Stephania cephalantha TaxID=152367 RepID=A0AAP0KPX9_9MAGN